MPDVKCPLLSNHPICVFREHVWPEQVQGAQAKISCGSKTRIKTQIFLGVPIQWNHTCFTIFLLFLIYSWWLSTPWFCWVKNTLPVCKPSLSHTFSQLSRKKTCTQLSNCHSVSIFAARCHGLESQRQESLAQKEMKGPTGVTGLNWMDCGHTLTLYFDAFYIILASGNQTS